MILETIGIGFVFVVYEDFKKLSRTLYLASTYMLSRGFKAIESYWYILVTWLWEQKLFHAEISL